MNETTPKRQNIRLLKLMLQDMLVIILAYLVTLSVRVIAVPEPRWVISIIAMATLHVFVLYLHDVYRIYWERARGENIVVLMRSMFWIVGLGLIVDLLIQPRLLPLSVLLVGSVLSFGALVAVRYQSRLLGAIEWRWRAIVYHEFPEDDRERVLIVGAGESGHSTAQRLQHHYADSNFKIVGFVDDDLSKAGLIIEGAPVLGTTQNIPQITQDHDIDLIVVTIHNIAGTAFRRILQQCEASTARVKVVPDMLKMFNTRLSSSFLRDVQPEDIIGRRIITTHEDVDLSMIAHHDIMVTGAAGSIGSELARQICQFHHPNRLILLDNNESGLYDVHQDLCFNYPEIDIQQCLVDVSQKAQVDKALACHRPDIIFHAAAYKHVPMLEKFPNQAVRVNIGGTYNMLQAAIANHVSRFILISTDKAVNPISVMGASKRVCERMLCAMHQQYSDSIQVAAVRFGNVLGSRGSVVPLFNHQIDMGGPVTITDERMTRYFMSISEAVNLVIHAAAMTRGCDTFVLNMGEVISIKDLAHRMIRLRGLRPDIDIPIKYIGIRPGEKLHEGLHEKYEKLQSTQHPEIRRLTPQETGNHAASFMEKLNILVQNGIADDDDAMTVLRTLYEHQTQPDEAHLNLTR